MNLYKRPNSSFWWFDVTIDGKRKRISTKREDKQEATLVASEYVKQRRDETQLGVRPIGDLKEVAQSYLDKHDHLGDLRNIKARVFRVLAMYPNQTTKDVNQLMVDDLLKNLKGQKLKPATINQYIGDLQRVYRHARDTGFMVVHDIKWPRLPTTEKKRYLLDGEEERLLAELDPDRPIMQTRHGKLCEGGVSPQIRKAMQDQYDLAIFLLDTGARYSEISTITWDCVDTRDWRWITIYRSKVDNEGTLGLRDPARQAA